ncbi:hypothetical protein [Formivibrio citricus]|uniref:hypothetical protein n=1 Tax=Formivibrio citricus TaxID=83765 RepID=UPI0011605BF0|nr:hypothetical protein [Formivibrio citricus]
MIDILLVDQCALSLLGDFVSDIFGCSIDMVKVFEVDEFNSLNEELDASVLDCVCVYCPVRGGASQLLQLYRYKLSDAEVLKRIVGAALKNGIRCYIPCDSFDGWIYVGEGGIKKRVRQVECDDDCFLFKPI